MLAQFSPFFLWHRKNTFYNVYPLSVEVIFASMVSLIGDCGSILVFKNKVVLF
jgi:hypothetical protein